MFHFHVEGSLEDGDILPEAVVKGEYNFEYDLRVSAILHRLEGVITLSALHKATGINEKQLWHYKSGIRTPRPVQRKRIVEGIHQLGEELLSFV